MGAFVTNASKLQLATISLTADFLSQLALSETLTAITTSIVVSSGTDATPSAVLDGLPTTSGSVATQVVTAGVSGVIYLINFNGTTSAGNELIIQTYLAVLSSNPFQET
mgnify:CR=1 FL=1